MVVTIAIELDGTLARYEGWEGVSRIGDPLPGAREMLHQMKDDGYYILIHTTRTNIIVNQGHSSFQLATMINAWLSKHDLYHLVDEVWVGIGKPLANVYVDDRAFAHETNAEWTEDEITRLRRA